MSSSSGKKKETVLETKTSPSPFGSATVKLFLKSSTLRVHKAFLADKPQLYGTGSGGVSGEIDSTQVLLKETSLEVGHVLVMWLYSGTYQLLPRDAEATPREALKTALEVYVLALKYDLSGLESLARDQVTRHGDEVGIYTTINVVLEVYPLKSKGDEWLNEFLSTRTKEALKNDPTSAVMPKDAGEQEETTLIAKTIVRSVLDAYREKSEELVAREAVLEEATRALAAQQLSFDNVVRESANAPPAETSAPPRQESSIPGPSEESNYELAPEEVPEVFAMAVVEELSLPRQAPGSPENDWVMTSPRAAELEPEDLAVSSKKSKKDKKGKKNKTAEPEPEPQPEPEPEPPSAPEPEPAVSKKDKKKKKKGSIWDDLVEERAGDSKGLGESGAVADLVVEDHPDPWATWGLTRKPSKGDGKRPVLY
ncbi:hypothetical protein B0T18DRAFT_165284 [Schizothecium vesticola]|uniref:BTB domain-containing protein n=1 Tax=Schizothecium vesticola TaxID=314040 RepID=A0AA40EX04_9PEZI|nr:hypothetical protein B0T18DRAFT_165284 [Schizothecium vesticola]